MQRKARMFVIAPSSPMLRFSSGISSFELEMVAAVVLASAVGTDGLVIFGADSAITTIVSFLVFL